MAKTIEKVPEIFKPSTDQQEAMQEDYGYLSDMTKVKTTGMPHFASGERGNRSWLQYIDDSERVLNGYVETREAQGKESWSSNLLDNITLAKCRAIAAGVGLKVPGMVFSATNKKGIRSLVRADLFKNIVKQSYLDGNQMLHAFLQVWQLICHGTIFEYEGYRTGGAKVRRVESFDSRTGDIEIEEKYVKYDGKPYSVLLNPQEFYWWDMKVRDVQKQKRLAWLQVYGLKDLEEEFGKYKYFKYLKDKKGVFQVDSIDTKYFTQFMENMRDEEYLVFRMYDKERDVYRVWIHDVPIIDAPLLWGGDEKVYPFAKQINQAFANSNFFVGMSWPAILESYQDAKNTQINTLIDKTYRSMEVPMLIGLQNKDLFDIESQLVNQDNRYYVPDVNQVKPYPIQGVQQGELAMLNVLNQGIELLSVDRSQQGIASETKKTARQSVIDDTRAQELKGSLYLSLEDLWYQKTKLRTEIILTHYLKDKAMREETKGQIISVNDYTFGDGDRGILDIHLAKGKGSRLTLQEIQAREDAMEQQGQAYKLISIPWTYLNEWEYDFTIVPLSFHNQDRAVKEEDLMGEIQAIGILAPEFLAENKEQYIERILELQGRNITQYNKPKPAPTTPPQEGTPVQEGEQILAPLQNATR